MTAKEKLRKLMVKTNSNSSEHRKFVKTVPECVKAVWGIAAVCGGLKRFL